LLGFQLQAPFQNAFDTLSRWEKTLELAVLGILVLVIGLIVAPSARHRIVENGNATPAINAFMNWMSFVVLVPFSIALTLDLTIGFTRIGGMPAGIMAGLVGLILSLSIWYGPILLHRHPAEPNMTEHEQTPTSAKIEYVLTEARVVLPGVQAFLGFQLAIVLTDGFADLPYSARILHGVALGLMALATILLIAPASYHRLVYNGDAVPQFHRVASRLMLGASLLLACGMAADIYVVVEKITESSMTAAFSGGAAAAVLIGLWYAWPVVARARMSRSAFTT
jgi:hypothetical protein